jgi:hypothetical protein
LTLAASLASCYSLSIIEEYQGREEIKVFRSASIAHKRGPCQGLGSRDQLCELHHFMHMYNYFLKARVSLRTLSSPVINLFTQVAIVLELALVSSQALSLKGLRRYS